MIDTHIHVVRPQLPGVGPLHPLLDRDAETVAAALHQELAEADAEQALAMGQLGGSDEDPLGVASTLAIARHVPGLHAVGVANPLRIEQEHLRRADKALAGGQVRALKAYLGYLHFPPDHPGYRPYY